MRIVLDTNIYIAAATHEGFSAHVFETLSESADFTVIISSEILDELGKKLKDKFNWLTGDIVSFLAKVKNVSELVKITEKISIIARDPDDNKILECALSGKGDLIVTLGQDLIKIKTFKGIGIVHSKTLTWILPKYFKQKTFHFLNFLPFPLFP